MSGKIVPREIDVFAEVVLERGPMGTSVPVLIRFEGGCLCVFVDNEFGMRRQRRSSSLRVIDCPTSLDYEFHDGRANRSAEGAIVSLDMVRWQYVPNLLPYRLTLQEVSRYGVDIEIAEDGSVNLRRGSDTCTLWIHTLFLERSQLQTVLYHAFLSREKPGKVRIISVTELNDFLFPE